MALREADFPNRRREIILWEANPMSGVFQNIEPHPLNARQVCTPPPAFSAGGGHTRWVERRMRGQYFGRRQTQLCTLHM
jgi:hypothetical protein